MRHLLLELIVLLFSTSLSAQTYVEGVIDGEIWTPAGSPYIMIDSLYIANLEIRPGVTVKADGDYEIEVAGLLTAIGSVQDSIFFATTDSVDEWQGILFNVTTFPSVLEYCRIEKSINAGIRIFNSTPTIQYCTLINNTRADNPGGGINIYNDTVTDSELDFQGCRFINNRSGKSGGAMRIYSEEGHVLLDNTYFEGNVANGLTWNNGDYVGGAIYIQNGSVTITNSSFIENRSNAQCTNNFDCNVIARGGAIYMGSTGDLTVRRSSFYNNRSHAQNNGGHFFGGTSKSYGASVYVNSGTATITNSIFSDNLTTRTDCGPSDGGGGVYVNGGSVTVTNCVIADNSDATGAHRSGGALEIMNSILFFNNESEQEVGGTATISYSCVQDGDTTNGNITDNPIFIDSLYHLGSLSPCIDAGNPDVSFNDLYFPPSMGTERNDMGAYGGPETIPTTVVVTESQNITPDHFALQQNFPNPFNSSTTIRYTIERTTSVQLKIYNILGATVRTLVSERKTPGEYSETWDGRNDTDLTVSSGIYFCALSTGDGRLSLRKMLYLK